MIMYYLGSNIRTTRTFESFWNELPL